MSTPSWPTTADAVIRRAMRDIGLGEKPPGSNRNKISDAFGIGPGPWCAMAVWFWFKGEGVDLKSTLPGGHGWAYTPAGVASAKQAGMWHQGAAGIKRGDVVFYKLPGAEGSDFVNHVGIVTATASGSVQSIEGNTSNIVAIRTRTWPNIVGYMRPPYKTAKPSPAPPPFPGTAAFRIGKKNPAVTLLDGQLIRLGYTKHTAGKKYTAGPEFTRWTRDNVRDFQQAQGWRGADADGYPGPETWARLFKSTTKAAG
ncbi:peptidoglycan-binding protein [Streptomyces sp. NPDC048157]|uniref:peptidoglycan-binding protein n=1 Tax=Streptomyces sp. NPDC048157 TaxID=3365503 RepID=UPI00371ECAAF